MECFVQKDENGEKHYPCSGDEDVLYLEGKDVLIQKYSSIPKTGCMFLITGKGVVM